MLRAHVELLLAALLLGPAGAYFLEPVVPVEQVHPRAVLPRHGAGRRPPSAPRVWQPRALPPIGMMGMSREEAFRTLGMDDDSTDEEIFDQYERMKERYEDDPEKVAVLDLALSTALSKMDDRVDDLEIEEEEEKKAKKKAVRSGWVTRILKLPGKFLEIPSPQYAFQVCTLIGGLAAWAWYSPSQAGGLLMLNTMSAAGFMYNRGEAPAVLDDMGQVGEVQPTKPGPMAFTILITAACYYWGYLQAKARAQTKALELCLRVTYISLAYVFPCLFIKVHPIFEGTRYR